MSYIAQIPKITSASIDPNPVSINGDAILSVVVIEETVILYPEVITSGEIYSGEAQ